VDQGSVDLFKLTKDDFVDQVKDIITVGEFYDLAAIELTTENFTDTVGNGGIVLVDFWASWLRPVPYVRARHRGRRRPPKTRKSVHDHAPIRPEDPAEGRG
jgi:hypothetical protein